MDTRELRELAKGIREIFGGFKHGEGLCEYKVYSTKHPEYDEVARCFADQFVDRVRLAKYIAALSPDVLEGLCDKADKSYPHMCRDEHDEIGFRNSEIELCPVCEAKNRAEKAEAENERLRDALREALNHWRMYAEQDPDFESTTDPTPESIEYRKCRAALFPKHCDLCDKMMESLEDRTQWHGLGNCVEICSHCNGSGVEPAPDQKRETVSINKCDVANEYDDEQFGFTPSAPQAAQCPKYMILEKALRNLMAVIFRDGGQKAASFSRNYAKAAQAAESAVVALLAKGRESTQPAPDQKGKP
jgi:hypothetical protein